MRATSLKALSRDLMDSCEEAERVLEKLNTSYDADLVDGPADDIFGKYSPDQARDERGRWTDGGGGGGVASGVSSMFETLSERTVQQLGGRKKPKAKKPSSIKEITALFRQAKQERKKVRGQIRALKQRIRDYRSNSQSKRKAQARLHTLQQRSTDLTREMKRLSDLVANRRGPKSEQDMFGSLLAGLPVYRPASRRGLKRANDNVEVDPDDLFDKGYPEYDEDQPRANDGKWVAGSGTSARTQRRRRQKGREAAEGKKPKKAPAKKPKSTTTTGKPKKAPAKKPKPKAEAKPKTKPERKPRSQKPPKAQREVPQAAPVQEPAKWSTAMSARPPPPVETPAVTQPQEQPVSGLVERDRQRLSQMYERYDQLTASVDTLTAQYNQLTEDIDNIGAALMSARPDSWREHSLNHDYNDRKSRRDNVDRQLRRVEADRGALRTTIGDLERRLRGEKRARKFSKRHVDKLGYTCTLTKADDGLGLIFGWAIVSSVDGEPYFDTQGDHIPEDAMLEAAAEFMTERRSMKIMHEGKKVGTVVFAWPMTEDIAEAMGIEGKRTGLMIAVKPDNPNVIARFREGKYTGFSIGGNRLIDEDVD